MKYKEYLISSEMIFIFGSLIVVKTLSLVNCKLMKQEVVCLIR